MDCGMGGIPRGALTQICAPVGITSGRTALLLSLLAQVTGKEQFCAVVDASDVSILNREMLWESVCPAFFGFGVSNAA